MTIGELLKDYRIKQGKTQREFIAGIVSQSYYSKVEKEIHRITADDLLEILNHNGIPVKEFFEKSGLWGGFLLEKVYKSVE